MAIKLGEMFWSLGLGTASFHKAAQGVENISLKTAKSVERSFKLIGTAVAGAAIAAAGALTVMGKQFLDNADRLNKMSQSTGVSVERLSGLQHAAELAGLDTEALATGLAKLTKQNVDVEKLSERFRGMTDPVGKAQEAIKLLGRDGARWIPFLNQNLTELREEAERMGLVISSQTAAAAERFNDTLTRMSGIAKGLVAQALVSLLPILQDTSEALLATDVSALKVSDTFFNKLTLTALTAGAALRALGIWVGEVGVQFDKMSVLEKLSPFALFTPMKRAPGLTTIFKEEFDKVLALGVAWRQQMRELIAIKPGEGLVGGMAEAVDPAEAAALKKAAEKRAKLFHDFFRHAMKRPELPAGHAVKEILADRALEDINKRMVEIAEQAPTVLGEIAEIPQEMVIFAEAAEASFKKLKPPLSDLAQGLKEVGMRAADSFRQAIILGRGFRGVLQALLYELANFALSGIFTQIAKSLTGKSGGSGFLGALGGFLGGLFGGGRQFGGDVEAGKVYETHGLGHREIFVPAMSGRIVAAGAGGLTIIQHIDARGADPASEFRILRASTHLAEQIARTEVARLVDRTRRGRTF